MGYRRLTATVLSALALSGVAGAAEFGWGGYFRDDVTVTDRRFGLVTGTRLGNYLRLRLDLDASLNEHVSVTATPQFIYLAGDEARDPYFGLPLEKDYDVGLARAQVDFLWDRLQMTLGKQRLDLSTAYFYSPLDIFNPPDYTEPKSEREGVTSGRLRAYFTGFSGVGLLLVPEDTWETSPKAGRLFATFGEFDVGLSYLEPGYERLGTAGFDLAGSVGDWGMYLETAADVRGGELNPRAAAGLNYGWRRGPNITLEYYRDERGATDVADYDLKDYYLGRRLTLGRDMAGLVATYYPHPMWLAGLATIANLHDGSYYLNPSVTWSAFEDVDVKVETDFFNGAAGTEFYYQHPVYRFQVMAYF
jgi:hypothetical protein